MKILIEDHTGKKANSKDSNKLGLGVLWLEVRETKAYEPKEWKINNKRQLHLLPNEEITLDITQLGREGKKQFQHFITSAEHLPQEYIDNIPLEIEKKNTILQKLCPSPAAGDNVVQCTSREV